MLAYLRYALAIACFAACLGCLWWRHASVAGKDYSPGPIQIGGYWFEGESGRGTLMITAKPVTAVIRVVFTEPLIPTEKLLMATKWWRLAAFDQAISRSGQFGVQPRAVHFPLWYPALIFALAGIAALRLGRRFTLRAAIIATTVVAILLAIPAML